MFEYPRYAEFKSALQTALDAIDHPRDFAHAMEWLHEIRDAQEGAPDLEWREALREFGLHLDGYSEQIPAQFGNDAATMKRFEYLIEFALTTWQTLCTN